MASKISLHERPARASMRAFQPREIPMPSYYSARDTVHRTAKTRAGMACGVVIAALVQFVPDGTAHGPWATVLALAPAGVIAALSFPWISWALKRDEARLKIQHGIRRKR